MILLLHRQEASAARWSKKMIMKQEEQMSGKLKKQLAGVKNNFPQIKNDLPQVKTTCRKTKNGSTSMV
mgnify:CR=1 FL=1